jgi:hypothetical protein
MSDTDMHSCKGCRPLTRAFGVLAPDGATMTNNHLTRISFRVKPDERKRIIADAKLAGMSIGSYVRSRLLDVPQTAITYRRTQTRRLINHLIGQLGRVGNNMNQIAWKLNSGTMLVPLDRECHEEGVRALKEMRVLLVNHLMNGPC